MGGLFSAHHAWRTDSIKDILLSRWKSLFSREPPPLTLTNPGALPQALTDLLTEGRASSLHQTLRELMVDGQPFPIMSLVEAARDHAWSEHELQKLNAYIEFFSGQTAAAYRRVIEGGLARRDYPLFMTACVQCYLHDRYAEGYALLKQFDPDHADDLDPGEFLAYAGYLSFSGGGSAGEAMAYFDTALDLGLISPLLVVNAYPIYVESGRHERADQVRRLIHEHYPDDPEAIYAVATVELARDYYPEGFRQAEARYRMPEVARYINPTLLLRPRWQGEPLTGQRLLVHGEQGLGDLIMMSRYLPLLTAQGAQVTLDCRAEAIPLLTHNFSECHIIVGDLHAPIETPLDYWTGIMSLPFHLSTTADGVPAPQGYLTTPPEQQTYWRERVGDITPRPTPRIGLAWSGNPGHRADRRRSIPFDKIVSILREHASASIPFFALQTSVQGHCPANLLNLSEELITLADTAALIDEMDLVITVDTSIVHLAGALGKPTWLLLPSRYEWRWGLSGERNHWYDTVRVLRQAVQGDWDSLLTQVFGERLTQFIENQSG
jgi:hypothetical protein